MSYSDLQRQVVAQLECGRGEEWRGTATVAPLDYRHDARRCLTAVCFLPEVLARRLYATVSTPLQAAEPQFHYHPPDAMHVTIKNVRTASAPPRFGPADVAACRQVFATVCSRHPGFSFRLEDMVAFAASVSMVGYCDERLRDHVLPVEAPPVVVTPEPPVAVAPVRQETRNYLMGARAW